MKKLTFLTVMVLTMLSVSVTLFYTSCKKDPCKEVACLNGGACASGNCVCPTGFTGLHCETKIVDPCAGIVCQNGGACASGLCNCPAGYEGTFCEKESRAKFFGTYNGNENCSASGTAAYAIAVVADPGNVLQVRINNFWDSFNNPVVATMNGNTLNIALQEPDNDDFTVSGTATLNGNTLTISYTVTDTNTGDSDVCSGTFTR